MDGMNWDHWKMLTTSKVDLILLRTWSRYFFNLLQHFALHDWIVTELLPWSFNVFFDSEAGQFLLVWYHKAYYIILFTADKNKKHNKSLKQKQINSTTKNIHICVDWRKVVYIFIKCRCYRHTVDSVRTSACFNQMIMVLLFWSKISMSGGRGVI